MMRWVLGLALSLGPMLAGHVAAAHALLESAVPPVGGTVAKAPTDVMIVFSETVEPAFSSIVVTDAAGNRFDSGKAQTAAGDAKRLMIGVKPLQPGTYTVTWQATSTDTHRTQGHFSFTVAR
ncbi:MAG: copper resistance protein CopC [Alphaproteobacteria bacterium]|nr:copper resistance protein CopC [Alphaproteobacteria bacterium]